MKPGLAQTQFAALLGVSKRKQTIEQQEKGRREPSGAAKTLIRIVERHPETLHKLATQARLGYVY